MDSPQSRKRSYDELFAPVVDALPPASVLENREKELARLVDRARDKQLAAKQALRRADEMVARYEAALTRVQDSRKVAAMVRQALENPQCVLCFTNTVRYVWSNCFLLGCVSYCCVCCSGFLECSHGFCHKCLTQQLQVGRSNDTHCALCRTPSESLRLMQRLLRPVRVLRPPTPPINDLVHDLRPASPMYAPSEEAADDGPVYSPASPID